MKMFKKLMLSMLIMCGVSSLAYGMNPEGISPEERRVLFDKVWKTLHPKRERTYEEMQADIYPPEEYQESDFKTFCEVIQTGLAPLVKMLLESIPANDRFEFIAPINRPFFGTPYYDVDSLVFAIRTCQVEIVNMLIDSIPEERRFGIVRSAGGIFKAVETGKVELLRFLLESIPGERRAEIVMSSGAIMRAVKDGRIGMVRVLLGVVPAEHVFRVVMTSDEAYFWPMTIFEYALRTGKAEMVSLLLEAVPEDQRADVVMTKDWRGSTALQYAEGKGYAAIAEVLAEYSPKEAQQEDKETSKKRTRDDGDGNSDAPKRRESKESESGCAIM